MFVGYEASHFYVKALSRPCGAPVRRNAEEAVAQDEDQSCSGRGVLPALLKKRGQTQTDCNKTHTAS
jgi:hypothetical protein